MARQTCSHAVVNKATLLHAHATRIFLIVGLYCTIEPIVALVTWKFYTQCSCSVKRATARNSLEFVLYPLWLKETENGKEFCDVMHVDWNMLRNLPNWNCSSNNSLSRCVCVVQCVCGRAVWCVCSVGHSGVARLLQPVYTTTRFMQDRSSSIRDR